MRKSDKQNQSTVHGFRIKNEYWKQLESFSKKNKIAINQIFMEGSKMFLTTHSLREAGMENKVDMSLSDKNSFRNLSKEDMKEIQVALNEPAIKKPHTRNKKESEPIQMATVEEYIPPVKKESVSQVKNVEIKNKKAPLPKDFLQHKNVSISKGTASINLSKEVVQQVAKDFNKTIENAVSKTVKQKKESIFDKMDKL